jgi:hypothetical protein
MTTDLVPPTIEAAMAEGWTGLRVTCPVHGTRSVSWLAIAPYGSKRVSLSSVVDWLRCHECHRPPSEVWLQSDTGSVLLGSEQRHSLE